MTNVQESLKDKAIKLIEDAKEKLGSYAAVAAKCRVSVTAISQIRGGTYTTEGNDMYRRIINSLELISSDWAVVETRNMKRLFGVFKDARKEKLFMAVSEKAGSGKTTAITTYVQRDETNASYLIKCRKWGNRVFLMQLLRSLGINPESRYSSNDELLEQVIEFFKMRVHNNPILFIDQANSLKASALTNIIIHLYNELEGQLAVVITGTENLEKEIKKGVRISKDGFDEADSRLGRKYITLLGFTQANVAAICKANGIASESAAVAIFNECEPIQKRTPDGIIKVIEDGRRLKRIIQRELLKANN